MPLIKTFAVPKPVSIPADAIQGSHPHLVSKFWLLKPVSPHKYKPRVIKFNQRFAYWFYPLLRKSAVTPYDRIASSSSPPQHPATQVARWCLEIGSGDLFSSPRSSWSRYRLRGLANSMVSPKPKPEFGSSNIPPENKTLSSLTARVLMMAFCPSKFCMNAPSGHFHCLMLPVLPLAKVHSVGWTARALTPFLWCVRVAIVLPAARSHSLTVESSEALMTWGSASWHLTSVTVCLCPLSTWILLLVLISHTLATPSRPPVTSTSRVGWRDRV